VLVFPHSRRSSLKKKLRGSFDLIGINHYNTYCVADLPISEDDPGQRVTGQILVCLLEEPVERNGIPISNETSFYRMPVVPWGIQELLEYMKTYYHNPPVSILENGFARAKNSSSLEEALADWFRVDFLTEYLKYVSAALRNRSYLI
jgi:beta-glucosidase